MHAAPPPPTPPPGEYHAAFVSEFRVFTAELRDFFNAGSLADGLAAIRGAMDDATGTLVDRFLQAKAVLDGAGAGADANLVMDALHGATSVRAAVAAGLGSGLRNDAPDAALVMRQRCAARALQGCGACCCVAAAASRL